MWIEGEDLLPISCSLPTTLGWVDDRERTLPWQVEEAPVDHCFGWMRCCQAPLFFMSCFIHYLLIRYLPFWYLARENLPVLLQIIKEQNIWIQTWKRHSPAEAGSCLCISVGSWVSWGRCLGEAFCASCNSVIGLKIGGLRLVCRSDKICSSSDDEDKSPVRLCFSFLNSISKSVINSRY